MIVLNIEPRKFVLDLQECNPRTRNVWPPPTGTCQVVTFVEFFSISDQHGGVLGVLGKPFLNILWPYWIACILFTLNKMENCQDLT